MKKITTVIEHIEEFLLSFAVIAMAIILVAGVIARSVFNSSLTFTEELGTALNIAVTFLGVGYCARKAKHISMSIIFDLLGKKPKKVMMLVISLGTAAVMAFLCYLSVRYVGSVYKLARVTPALRIPMWIIYTTLPIGFFLAAAEYLKTFFKNLTDRDEVWISAELKVGENIENYDDLAADAEPLPEDTQENHEKEENT